MPATESGSLPDTIAMDDDNLGEALFCEVVKDMEEDGVVDNTDYYKDIRDAALPKPVLTLLSEAGAAAEAPVLPLDDNGQLITQKCSHVFTELFVC